jgi:hypothetical protein
MPRCSDQSSNIRDSGNITEEELYDTISLVTNNVLYPPPLPDLRSFCQESTISRRPRRRCEVNNFMDLSGERAALYNSHNVDITKPVDSRFSVSLHSAIHIPYVSSLASSYIKMLVGTFRCISISFRLGNSFMVYEL